MSRFSAGMTALGVGTTLQPIFGVLGTATKRPRLREISLWNNTAVDCLYEVVQITGGTPGSTVTSYDTTGSGDTPLCTAKGLWTVNGTVVKTGYRIELGAAKGSAAFLAFGDIGLGCALGTTVGLALVPIGTGQLCEVTFVWDE